MRRFALAVAAIACLLASCTASFLGGGERGWPDAQVAELLRQLPPEGKYPDATALVILDQDIIEVFPEGDYERRCRTVIKVLKEAGKGYGDVSLGFNSRLQRVRILHARTITPDGRVIPLRKNAIKVTTPYSDYPEYSDYKELAFSLPGVEVGSVIDYEFCVEAEPYIKGHFSRRAFFQWSKPVLFSRYEITMPKDKELKYLVLHPPKGIDPSPLISHRGDKKVYLWEFWDLPGVPMDEYSTPPEGELTFNILVTTLQRWDDFFSWWRHLIEGKTEPDEAIRRKVQELTKGLKDRRSKIRALFDFVKLKIRYVSVDLGEPGYEPTPAREVLENKYGDCKDKSTLLISMLAAAGIKAYYVFIPTHYTEDMIREIPYPFQFDHCIVAVPEGEGYLFLDPTDSMRRFGYLPAMDRGRKVLIFKDDEVLFAKTPSEDPPPDGVLIRQTIKVGEDGSLEISALKTYLGDSDFTMRRAYEDKSPAQIKEDFKSNIESWSPGAKLIDYHCTDPFDFTEWFRERYKFYAPNYCERAGDLLFFKIPNIWAGCIEWSRTRKYPLDIWGGWVRRHEMEIIPPPGYKILRLPEPIKVKSPYLDFEAVYEERAGKIFYRQEFIQKAVRISPEEYPTYRRFCQRVEVYNRKETIFFIKAKGKGD